MNAGEEDLGELVVARGDGPEMPEFVEEPLNEIAFAVEAEVAWARGCSVGFGWDDGDDRSIVEGGDEGVGVERLVGDQSAGVDGFDEALVRNLRSGGSGGPPGGSGEPSRDGHAESGHAVEHLAADPGLDLLCGQSPGAERLADDGVSAAAKLPKSAD